MTIIRPIVSVRPQDSLLHVIKVMQNDYVPKLVVTDEAEHVLGILTQKDIIASIDRLRGRLLADVFVSEIMRKDFITIENGIDPIEAARLIVETRSPMLVVVSEDKRALGMILKSDLVSYYGSTVKGVHKVEDVMTKDPVTVSEDMSIKDAVEILKSKALGRVIVTDKGGKVIGMLTTADVVPIIPFVARSSCEDVPVKEFMSTSINVANPNEDLGFIAKTMIQRRLKSFIVIDDNGKPVGIVTSSDIVKALTDEKTRKFLIELKMYSATF